MWDFGLVELGGRLAQGLIHPGARAAMVPRELLVDGRRFLYAASDNEGASPIWAVNIHGYFAGGETYWRESALLADRFGWRVLNPSLPGFGGSDPLDWNQVTMDALADRIALMMEDAGAGPAILLGHSMGAAVAVRYATEHPESVLGLVYRAGVATPAWKERHGLLASALSPALPDVAPLVDLVAAALLDIPDLLLGRISSNVRAILPDVRRNFRTAARTLPVASMLMQTDLRAEVEALVAARLPFLVEWGCFDRVATDATAAEVEAATGVRVQWVPGGHSWMLARPKAQADMLVHLPSGQSFLSAVERRRRTLRSGQKADLAESA